MCESDKLELSVREVKRFGSPAGVAAQMREPKSGLTHRFGWQPPAAQSALAHLTAENTGSRIRNDVFANVCSQPHSLLHPSRHGPPRQSKQSFDYTSREPAHSQRLDIIQLKLMPARSFELSFTLTNGRRCCHHSGRLN